MEPGQETVRWLKFGLDVKLNSISINAKPFTGSMRVGQLDPLGIGVFLPANLRKGDSASLTFTLPKSDEEVTVSAKLHSRTGFRYRFEFVKLTPELQAKITQAVADAETK